MPLKQVKNKIVSVVIPVYNSERTLEDTLLSLRNQSYGKLEILVVDDGSSDGSLEIAEKYADKVLPQEHKGAGAARNNGAKNALGDILLFTDSDCVLPFDWVEKNIINLSVEGVECAGGGYLLEKKGNFMERFIGVELYSRRKRFPKYVNTLVSNNFSCLKKTFFQAGGFPEEFVTASAEDMILSYKISRFSKIIWDHENPVIHHHRSSVWSYLKQQYVFSRDSLLMYFHFPNLLIVKTHHPKRMYLELASICLLTCSLFLIFLSGPSYRLLYPILFFLLIIEILNTSFLCDLIKKMGWLMVCIGIIMIVIRDFFWLFGIAVGSILFLKSKLKR